VVTGVRRAVRQQLPLDLRYRLTAVDLNPSSSFELQGHPGGTLTIEGATKYETGRPVGLALIVVGSTALVVGTVVFFLGFGGGFGCGLGGSCTPSSASQFDDLLIGGGATALSGLGALISGIVLVAIYRRRPSVGLTLQDASLGGRIELDASVHMPVWGESRAVFAPRVATAPVLRLQF
jgi:hypothetical protein